MTSELIEKKDTNVIESTVTAICISLPLLPRS